MKVVAVILNWNNEPDTVACIGSLVDDGLALAQVILVDNASADGSGDRLRERYPEARYISTGANLGYAGGNNTGVQAALTTDADWVLVMNNDTCVERGMLKELIAAGEARPHAAALAPKIVCHDDPSRLWFDGGDFSWMHALGRHRNKGARDVLPDAREPVRVTFLSGCCLLLRASAIAPMPDLFRSDFFAYVEDAELGVRLARGGWQLWYVPAARLRHKVPAVNVPANAWQLHLRDRNRRRLVRSHYGLLQRMVFAGWFYPTRLLLGVRYLLCGDLPRAGAILRGSLER